ncbi:MAG: glycosyltransferase family 39 protein [Anaerolineales bacterium]|nr:glycosyltransferase family 39 protein [Anaerolineales bacterium]
MQRLAPLPLSDLGRDSRSQKSPTLALPGWLIPASIAGIILAGAALRLIWVFQVGLHPDEALYASWALRIADGSDPLLLGVYVDKPPFLPYLLAGIASLMGNTPDSIAHLQQLVTFGRLAGVGAGLASLALLWSLARPVYGKRVAALAVAFLALSPLTIRLSPSLLTDPWLVLWMLLGLWAAQRGRPWLAGIACGLAFATKQQALLILPLVLGVFLLVRHNMAGGHGQRPARAGTQGPARAGTQGLVRSASQAGTLLGDLWRLFCGFALIAVIVLWWDSQRWMWMPSYWERSAATYGGLALISIPQLAGHLAGWMTVLAMVLGLPLLLLLVILWGGQLVLAARGRETRSAAQPAIAGRFDALLALFLTGFLLLHLATSLAPWDRYALPLAPVFALLLARTVLWWADRFAAQGRHRARLALAGAVAAASLWAITLAASPRFPVADNATYDGVPALAATIRATAPADSVVYHRWFGWHYQFYLYGADLDLRWWQTPADLARQAASEHDRRQLIALPSAESRTELDAALARAGLVLTPVTTVSHPDGSLSATLFSVEPLAGAATDD